MAEPLNLELFKRRRSVTAPWELMHFATDEVDAILAALERIPELERLRRVEAAAQQLYVWRAWPGPSSEQWGALRAALELVPEGDRLRGIGTNEAGDAIAVYEDGSRVNLEQFDEPSPAEKPCPKCEGCGQVADTDDQEPWTFWLKLPLESAAAVLMGLVNPIPCPVCSSAPGAEGVR